MATEIEHKYLVNHQLWKDVTPKKSTYIKQGYLLSDPNKTIRVRTTNDKGFITIKGKTIGASRLEYEYEIPIQEANELLTKFCSQVIEKTRHYVDYENKLWEIDVFEGFNKGLIVAEIELTSEDEMYQKPNWIEKNVTADMRYSNSNLCANPFNTW